MRDGFLVLARARFLAINGPLNGQTHHKYCHSGNHEMADRILTLDAIASLQHDIINFRGFKRGGFLDLMFKPHQYILAGEDCNRLPLSTSPAFTRLGFDEAVIK